MVEANCFALAVVIAVSVVRPHVERDAEIAAFLPDLVIANHSGKAVLIIERLEGGYNVLDVIFGKEALCPLACHLVHRVDKEHLISVLLGLVHPADDDAGFHGRVVKEVGAETQHALHHVMSDQLFAHGRLFVAEENAMWKQNGAAATLSLHALDDVLPEGIVGSALGRGAVEVPAPRIGGPGIAVPLLYGVRRIGQDHIELHEPVAFDKGRIGQGIAPDDAEVLDAVQEQVHTADGRGEEVALLAEQPQVPPFLVLPLDMRDGGEQHAR